MEPPPAARVRERSGRRLWGAPGLGLPGGGILPPGAALVFPATALALHRATGQAGPVLWEWIG